MSNQAPSQAADLLLRLQANQGIGDEQDFTLLDESFGVRVVFLNPAVPMDYPAEQMEGIILDVRTNRCGRRQLLIKADKLNIPKWIDLQDVQFSWKTATASTVETIEAA